MVYRDFFPSQIIKATMKAFCVGPTEFKTDSSSSSVHIYFSKITLKVQERERDYQNSLRCKNALVFLFHWQYSFQWLDKGVFISLHICVSNELSAIYLLEGMSTYIWTYNHFAHVMAVNEESQNYKLGIKQSLWPWIKISTNSDKRRWVHWC